MALDGFTDVFQAQVTLARSHHLMARLHTSVDRETEWHDAKGREGLAKVYGIANMYYRGTGSSKIDVSQTGLKYRADRAYAGLGRGGAVNRANGKYLLYGEAQWNAGRRRTGDNHALGATAGFRLHW